MKNKTVKTYDLFMFIALFISLFYVYNLSIVNLFITNQKIIISLFIISLLLMTLTNYKYVIKEKHTNILLILLIILVFVLFRNGDIANGHYSIAFYTIYALYSIYILCSNNKWKDIAINICKIFVLEHIIATFICYLFPNFYLNNIFPLFPSYKWELLYQFNMKQIAGITFHYSTNALYLVGGLIISSASIFFENKNVRKKDLIYFISNAIALLLTGKRGMVLFFILSFICCLLVKYRKNYMKATFKILFGTVIAIIGILFMSLIIPSITNPFERMLNTFSNSSSINSRNILYDYAIEEFNNNKLIGIGWDNYKYHYNLNVHNKEREFMLVHCIYLELLCETGVIGFAFFVAIFIILLAMTYKDVKLTDSYIAYLFLMFHLYFLLEGILGNSLYDMQIFIPYSLICSMYLYEHYEIKKRREKNEKI